MWTRLGTAGVLVVASCGIALACDEEAKSTTRSRVMIHTTDNEQDDTAYFGIQLGADEHGIRIIEVIDDSPAERAGFEAEDVIVAFGGQDIDGVEQFVKVVANAEPGDDVLVEYMRDGVARTRTITLGTRTDMPRVMAIGRGHDLPEEVMETLQRFDGGSISVEVECEDGVGVATIERDGDVIETHEFDCDEDGENMNVFKFRTDGDGPMWFGNGANVIELKDHLGHIEILKDQLQNMEIEIDDENMPFAIMQRGHFLGRDREPTIRFREDSDGHIEVTIRKGDTELIKEFKNAADLERRDEELFEKYEDVQN